MADKYTSLSEEEIQGLLENIQKNKLINEKKELDLDIFNDSLKAASENLGTIIPSIVEVSKEQVAIINHGLEGVINFVRAFQTVNTTFAVMAENTGNPDKFNKFVNKLDQVTDLEKRIVTDVKDSLINLGALLKETIKETAVYYAALGKIIYSDSEEVINLSYKADPALRSKIRELYQRKEVNLPKTITTKLGLVQIIQSLENVSKEIKKIPDRDLEYYTIKAARKGAEKPIEISLDIDVMKTLKSLSGELLSSLTRVGLLVKDQDNNVQMLKSEVFAENLIAQSGIDETTKALEGIEKDIDVVKFFKDRARRLFELKNMKVEDKHAAALFKELAITKKDENKARELHDDIVKNQIKHITTIVRAFAEIVSLWGHQVDSEIHIGQVADKTAIALKKLTEVELKLDSNANTESLLITRDTQESIEKTCAKAKDLKIVGKVMQFLLQRLKTVVGFNESLEKDLRYFSQQKASAEDYKNRHLEGIKELIYERYPKMSKNVSQIITNFNNSLSKITDNRNIFENKRLFDEFASNYALINASLNEFKKELTKVNLSDITVENFEQLCTELQGSMGDVGFNLKNLFTKLNSLTNTFSNDINNFMQISDAYKEFVKEMAPMLDFIRYIVDYQKKLVGEKIEVKVMNYKIQGFQKLFSELEAMQKEQAGLEKELYDVMKSVGLTRSSEMVYQSYTKKLDEDFRGLFGEMQTYLNEYFSDKAKIDEAYNLVKTHLQRFEVDFRDYNNRLKGAKVGFFQKLFKTQSYKTSEFWDDLKNTKKSLEKYDKIVDKLRKTSINVEKISKADNNVVKKFCDFSVILVNDLLLGLKDLVNELYTVYNVMFLVVNNLKILVSSEGTSEDKQGNYIENFNKMLQELKKMNENISKAEDKTFDLEEFDVLPVQSMLEALNKVTDFSNIANVTEDQRNTINKEKQEIEKSVLFVKNGLLEFFSKFLIDVYDTRMESASDKEKTKLKDQKSKYLKLLKNLNK